MAKQNKNPLKDIEDLGKAAREEAKNLASDTEQLQTRLKQFFKENTKLTSAQLRSVADVLKKYKELQKILNNLEVSGEDYKNTVEKLRDLLEETNEQLEESKFLYDILQKKLNEQLNSLDEFATIKDKINNLDQDSIGLVSKNADNLDLSIQILRERVRLLDKAQSLIDIKESKLLVDSGVFDDLVKSGVEFEEGVSSISKKLNELKNDRKAFIDAKDTANVKIINEEINSLSSELSVLAAKEIANKKKSTNALKSELGVRREINDAYEDYVRSVDSSYTKYAAIANLIPFIGGNISKAFLQAKDISIDAGKAIRDTFIETKDPIKALAAGMKVMRGHIGMMGPIIGGMVFAFKAVHGLLSSINEITKGIQAQTGLASVQAYDLYKNALSAQTAFHNQLSTLEDIIAVQTAYIQQYGRFSQLTDTTLVQISDAAKVFGYAAETASQLQGTFMELGADESIAGNMQVAVGNLAKANKLAPGVIAKDLVDNSEYLATNFAGMPIEAAKAAIEVRKLGYSLSQAAKTQDHLFDVQGSLTAQMEASVAMGKLIDVSAARNYALQGDTVKMMQEISKQSGTYAEFQKASVPQRMLLAKAFGMEVGELQKSLYIREKLTGLSEEEQKYALDHLKTLDGVEKMSAGQLKSEISKAQQAERFDVAISKVKNALIKAVLPVVESLVPILETVSNIISALVIPLKLVEWIFMGIGYVIEGLLMPLQFINDIIDDGLAGAVKKFGNSFANPLDAIAKVSLAVIGIGTAFKALSNIKFGNITGMLNMDTLKTKAKGIYDRVKGAVSSRMGGAAPTSQANAGGGIGTDLQNSIKASKQIKPESGQIVKDFLKSLASGLQSMGSGKATAGAAGLTKASVGFTAMKPALPQIKALSKIDAEMLKKNLQGLASGLRSMGTGKTFMGSLGLALASLGFIVMRPAMVGIKAMASIDGEMLKKNLQGIASGLRSMGTTKVLLGSLALILASVGFIAAIPAAIGMAALGLAAPLAATGLTLLGVALNTFGAAMANPMALLGLALLVGTAVALGYALSLAAPAIQAFASSLESMSMERVLAIGLLGPALVLFSASAVIASLGLMAASIGFAAFALSFGYFGDKVLQYSDPISQLSDSILSLANSFKALQSVDMSKISTNVKTLGDVSVKSNATVDTKINSNPIKTKNTSNVDTETNPTYKDSNTTSQSTNINYKLDRLLNVMQQYISMSPQLVIEFDDGTVSKLKSKLKKTI
jgi:ferritin